jgi:membrane protease YdiL (CAAX protease family)
MVAYLVAGGMVAAVTLLVLSGRVPRLREEVGVRLEGGWRAVAEGLGAGAVAGGFGLCYIRAVDAIPSLHRLAEEGLQLRDALPGDLAAWLVPLAIVGAPLCEEFLFRGLVHRGLSRSTTQARATLASAALFAIVHPPISAVPVFVLGLLTATTFDRRRTLLAPMAAHALYNAVVLLR